MEQIMENAMELITEKKKIKMEQIMEKMIWNKSWKKEN